MQFLYPSFLWALSALAIPLAIHLFHLRRYKTVYFSDLRFLRDVEQTSKKQRKLKEWLVLAARMLAIAALVLAFARPFIPAENNAPNSSRVIIALDNSASNQAGLAENTPLERGKQLALALLQQLPDDAEIALATCGTGALYFQNKQLIASLIEKTQTDDRNFEAAQLESRLLETTPDLTVYWIGDLQKSTLGLQNLAQSSWHWVLMPTTKAEEANMANAAIDSVWVDAPFLLAGQPVQIFIRVKQNGNQTKEIDLELLTNGLPEATITAGNARDTVVTATLTQLSNGYNTAQINILNDDVVFDNNHYLAYFTPMANRVVELWQQAPSPLTAKIFSDDEFVFASYKTDRIDNQTLQQADVIILQEIQNLSPGLENLLAEQSSRSNILIIPPATDAAGLNGLAQKLGIRTFGQKDTARLATQTVNMQDPFFADVFSGSQQKVYWPTVKLHYKLSGGSNLPAFNLLSLANGAPLFVRYAKGNTNVFQLASPLGEKTSDIATHPIVVPIFIKSLIKKDNISSLSGVAGTDSRFDFVMSTDNSQQTAQLVRGPQRYIPRQQFLGTRLSVYAGSEHSRSGYYSLEKAEEKIATIAFNRPATESDLARYTTEDLQDYISKTNMTNLSVLQADAPALSATFAEWQQGKHLWRYFLAAALFFVLIEIIFLRFLK